MNVEPELKVRYTIDKSQTPAAGLSVDDDDCTVTIELDMADIEREDFTYPAARVPQEHDDGPIALVVAVSIVFFIVGLKPAEK